MTSLNKHARVAGLLYILASVIGFVRLGNIPKTLIVDGNAAATVTNIVAHEGLFRVGILCYLLGAVVWLFVPLALYRLLKGVDQDLAVLMVILGSLMQVPIFFVNSVTDAATLMFARGTDVVSVFDKTQREAWAMVFLDLHHHLDLVNAIFWGLWLLPFGLLVYRSRFLPRWLGVLLILACFAWLAFSLTGLMFPQYESTAYKFSQPFALGEVVAMMWLAIVGARQPRLPAGTPTAQN